jgi:phytoene dehydrogenase-like protein
MVIVIGAGLAGLTCAKHLYEGGQQVLVLEAADAVGGRVRTDIHEDGYRLDRGFQVLFSAYPAAERHLNFERLKMRKFDPGAILVKDGKHYEIADPLREPDRLLAGLFNPLISTADKLRILRLRRDVVGLSVGDIFDGKGQPGGQDESTEAYLRRLGFAEEGFIRHFARPFYGGVFLDRSLQTSARMFQFTFKMMATGNTIVPAEGMQRIPEQLAAALPAGSIRYHARVTEVLVENGKARGVRLANGETLAADMVVVATETRTAEKLTGMSLPTTPVGSICLYFAGSERLYAQRKVLLNANSDGLINNAVLLTNIAPTYAPPRKHLLSVTVLNTTEQDDEALARRCRGELARWFLDADLSGWKFLAAYRIPYSQFAQTPGIFNHLPDNHTPVEGMFLAGEYTKSSSIQGAMHSGEYAAKAILKVPLPVRV